MAMALVTRQFTGLSSVPYNDCLAEATRIDIEHERQV
jgi:hypothetical protein